jgi:hypothetical protein
MPEVSPQPNQPTQPQAPQGKGISWKKIVVSVVVILVVVGAIAGALYWYFVLNEEETTTTEPTKVTTPSAKQATPSGKPKTPSTEKDETADWKTYTGESNGIKFSLKYPPSFKVTGFQWTSSPTPDPEAAGFGNNGGPGKTGPLENGEVTLAIKALTTDEFSDLGGYVGIEATIAKPTESSTFAGLEALKYSGRAPKPEHSVSQSTDGRVMYYITDQSPVDSSQHFIFECLFNPYTDDSLENVCETIASTFKFLE